MLPVNTALWALGGFYLSLGPTLARIVTGDQSALIGGSATLAAGMVVTLAGIAGYSAAAYFTGTAIMGAGFGAGFNGSLRSLVGLARPEERGELMSGFFAFSYFALSLPAILAGLAAGYFGLYATALGFLAGILLLVLVALACMFRQTRHAAVAP